MKKWICILLVSLLIIAMPVSAAEAPVLTPEIERLMVEAYCDTFGCHQENYDWSIRYYGYYDGCHVGFIECGDPVPTVETIVTIADVEFVFNDAQQLTVCKDGQAKNLQDAYDAGWIGNKGVHRLWNYYTNGTYEENPETSDVLWVPIALLIASATAITALLIVKKIA